MSSTQLEIRNVQVFSPTTTIVGITGTTAQFNTALTDWDFATLVWTETLNNKRITKRIQTLSSTATPASNTDSYDITKITGLATAITSMTSWLTWTPADWDMHLWSITDNWTARAITWWASFEASTVALPTTTVISTRLDVLFIWNSATSKWRCVASA